MNVPVLPPTTRRSVLAAAVGTVALGTACTPNSANKPAREPAAEPTPETLPDVALAITVITDEQALLDRIDATVARHPQLTGLLADARATHAAHVALLEDAVPSSATASPSAGDSPSAGETPSAEGSPLVDSEAQPPTDRVPRDPVRAVRALARHEEDLSLVDRRSAFAAESGAFARVLASMAAAAAQQATVLGAVAVRGPAR